MATAYKYSQIQGTAGVTTYATLYTTPSATEAVISSIAICNTDSSSATYRVAITTTEGTPSASEWTVYDATVDANDTIFLTVGISLDALKFIRVSSSASTVTFTAFVSEITG